MPNQPSRSGNSCRVFLLGERAASAHFSDSLCQKKPAGSIPDRPPKKKGRAPPRRLRSPAARPHTQSAIAVKRHAENAIVAASPERDFAVPGLGIVCAGPELEVRCPGVRFPTPHGEPGRWTNRSAEPLSLEAGRAVCHFAPRAEAGLSAIDGRRCGGRDCAWRGGEGRTGRHSSR